MKKYFVNHSISQMSNKMSFSKEKQKTFHPPPPPAQYCDIMIIQELLSARLTGPEFV